MDSSVKKFLLRVESGAYSKNGIWVETNWGHHANSNPFLWSHDLNDFFTQRCESGGKKMQKEWGQQITKYMATRKSLRGIILIMDVRHPLQESDLNFIAWCEQYNLPMQILLNKSDKLSKSRASQALMNCKKQTSQNLLLGEPMLLSAKTAFGVKELTKIILNLF